MWLTQARTAGMSDIGPTTPGSLSEDATPDKSLTVVTSTRLPPVSALLRSRAIIGRAAV